MKKFDKQPFDQQKAKAIGFTLGVHAIALIGLLYLGMTPPPKPPKELKTYLVSADQIADINNEQSSQTVKETETAPPVAENTPTPTDINKDLAAEQAKSALAKQVIEEKKKEVLQAKEKAIAEAKQKEALEAEAKQKEALEAEAKEKATAEAKEKAAAEAKQKATEAKHQEVLQAKQKAAAEAKEKAAAEAKQKATEAKHQEALQAKQKAAAEAKEKAAAEAKQKATEAKEKAAAEAKQKAAEDAANKKAESRKIASSAKHDFQQKIYRVWDVPSGSKGKTASVRVTLSDSGNITSLLVNSSDPDVKASVEAAIRQAAPYPMPSDPDARRDARSFSGTFTAKQ